MESEEGSIGAIGLDVLVVVCHPVSQILTQAENRQRLPLRKERYSSVLRRIVCNT